jgi:hypothetical protein
MALFVHLTSESLASRISRNGITQMRPPARELPRGIYATPVTRDFYVSHQWIRELRRHKPGAIAGIYFRVPDAQPVWMGHYGQHHRELTASQAIAEFSEAADRLGWEVLIPRRIEAKEILKVRQLPQGIGWRFYPGAKGKVPCTCPFCIRGDYGAAKLRERFGSQDD